MKKNKMNELRKRNIDFRYDLVIENKYTLKCDYNLNSPFGFSMNRQLTDRTIMSGYRKGGDENG